MKCSRLAAAAATALASLLIVCASPAAPPASLACNRVRFQASAGNEAALIGAKIEGSNVSRKEGFVTLGEVKQAPAAKAWGEVTFDNSKVYRWLRFTAPHELHGKVMKTQFYAGDQLIAGDGKGIDYHFFLPDAEDGQSIAYDLPDAAAQRPSIKPDPGEPSGPVDVTMGSTNGAVIRYTLDGSWPTMEHGETYSAPLHLDKTTTICAVACLPDHAPSLLASATYLLKGSSQPGLNTAHVGNSLTGTTGGFFRFARTAGFDHKSVAFLRPGALTRELWAVASGDYVNDKLALAKETAHGKKGGSTWADFWGKVGKVDLVTLQPRDFDLDKETAAEISFLKLFREKSPDLQPWLYCEWVEMARQRPSDKGVVPSFQMKKTFPALTWEESMGAMLLYMEELQHRLSAQYPEGKRSRIIPSALAMGWIKHMIDHGQFPGVKAGGFYPLLFNDQVHPADAPIHGTANGAYLVDMTWFSAFYHQKPEGKVLPIETSFTPEQARLVERLAWDVIQNYPDCGLYEEGAQPCARPDIANDGKAITLSSATPGTWFRYTLDGTPPSRTLGYVYCGVISVQPGIQVKAVAYKSGMTDSAVADGPVIPASK